MEKCEREGSDVQRGSWLKLAKQQKKQWLEKDILKEGGIGWKVKNRHKSTRGMFLLRLLSMESAHSIKSRHV